MCVCVQRSTFCAVIIACALVFYPTLAAARKNFGREFKGDLLLAQGGGEG